MSQTVLPPPRKILDELWMEIDKLNFDETAKRSGAVSQGNELILKFTGQDYKINSTGKTIINADNGNCAPFLLQLTIIHYLIKSRELSLANKLINPMELAGGDFFFRGPHTFKLEPLEEKFSTDKEAFLKAGLRLGGSPLEMGDAAFSLTALPRVPVSYVLWLSDDDFPAKINLLFDASADKQLPLDMLWALVTIINKELLK